MRFTLLGDSEPTSRHLLIKRGPRPTGLQYIIWTMCSPLLTSYSSDMDNAIHMFHENVRCGPYTMCNKNMRVSFMWARTYIPRRQRHVSFMWARTSSAHAFVAISSCILSYALSNFFSKLSSSVHMPTNHALPFIRPGSSTLGMKDWPRTGYLIEALRTWLHAELINLSSA